MYVLQAPKSKPSFNTRRAGEGEGDNTEWKKLIPLARPEPQHKKDAEEGDEEGEEGEVRLVFPCHVPAGIIYRVFSGCASEEEGEGNPD